MKNKLLFILLLFSFHAYSENKVEQLKNETISIESTNEQKNKEIEEKTNKVKADYWGLTLEEWTKYEKIKEVGGRGFWTPNLDPLTTLGVEAVTDQERAKYARLLAIKESERVEKELAFQRAYDKAWKELYPDLLPIELDGNQNFIAKVNFSGERLVLFLSVNDNVRGVNLLNSVLKTGKDLDIYLLDSNGDDVIARNWAMNHKIPVNKVNDGNITINHDSGQWLEIGNGNLPVLMQQQNKKWRQVEIN